MKYEIRPLGLWTDPETPARLGSGTFRATWQSTLDLLGYETEQLDAGLVVLQIDVQEGALRRDGMLKATAKVGHPGVAVSFESKFGPLRYSTDRYAPRWSGDPPGWQANVRAVALSLQALRAVDRYGATRRGEQYTGWSALPAATAQGSEWFTTDAEATTWLIASAAELNVRHEPGGSLPDLYRRLAKQMHPDVRGDRDLWDRLNAAATLLRLRDNGVSVA